MSSSPRSRRPSLVPRVLAGPVRRVGAVLVATAALGVPAAAQTARLNAPFQYEGVVGDVRDFVVKPNGNFVFFRADDRREGAVELLAASASGTTPLRRENLSLPLGGEVAACQTTAVGTWVVFLADQDEDETFELYSRTFTDTAPRRLNGALVAGGDVTSFALTPDGTRVVYVADEDVDEKFELYGVPIDASASPVRLSGTMLGQGDVHSFVMSPCSCRVVFHADRDINGRNELFSVPIDGSALPVRLNPSVGPLVGNVTWSPPAAITADGATVVYHGDLDAWGIFELYRVPIDGSSPAVQINPPLGGGRDVLSFQLTPDGERVVYSADQDTNGVIEVYAAPLDGSAPSVKLNAALPAGGEVEAFAISPDSAWVVMESYLGTDGSGAELAELRSRAIDGSGSAVLLDGAPDGSEIGELVISPDSSRVVYRTGVDPCLQQSEPCYFTSHALRSVPIDGSASPVRLDSAAGSPAPVTNPGFGGTGVPYAISADSTRVVYLWGPAGTAPDDLSGQGLYSVPIDGSAAAVALAAGGATYRFATSPAGSRVFFVADPADAGVFELYGAANTGTGLVKLSGPLALDTFADVALPALTPQPYVAALSIPPFALDPTGERVVHAADADADGEFQLFAGPVDGSGYGRPLGTDGIADRFLLDPDGTIVVYAIAGTPDELYSVPADRSASPTLLHSGELAVERHGYLDFQVSADGARVLFRAANGASTAELRSVPIGGGTAAVIEDDDVTRFLLAAGSDRVVYVVTPSLLCSAPIDGSGPPIVLDAALYYQDYLALTPDGARAVYSSLVPDCCAALAVVPVDGSASPLVLTGTLFASSPQVTPDGQWVVFAGQEQFFGVPELFSARLDGSVGPIKLNDPFQPYGGSLAQHDGGATVLLTPDSTRALFVADAEIPGQFQLFSVPVDGSASPVRIEESLPAALYDGFTLDLRHMTVSPDGSRLVFVDWEVTGGLQLYSVPVDGSAAPTRLNGDLVPGGSLPDASIRGAPFQISPDSQLVVYRADQEVDGVLELFLVPIDRSLEPFRLSSGGAFGSVGDLRITADSRRVVYQGSQQSGAVELFGTVLSFDSHRRRAANGDQRRP